MERKDLIKRIIDEEILIQGVLSNLRKKSQDSFTKVDIKPVLLKEGLRYQFAYYYTNKVLHKNLD